MSSINSCNFTGRLTSDPELKFTTNEKKRVCTFSIACERGFGDSKKTFFPTFVAWNAQAEFVSKLPKGTMVAITSELTERSYTDKQSVKRKVTEFVVTNIQATESKRTSNSNEQGQEPEEDGEQQNFEEYPNDDLPF